MTVLPGLALRSLWNRRFTAGLSLLSITLAVSLLLGVEKIRTEARDGFHAAVSGTDLIVGARASPVQLLLYSIFGIGEPTANVSWESFERISAHPLVAWSIPISLGDSHRGYRVLGTSDAYLQHYRFGEDAALRIEHGAWLDDLFDAVIGAEVARTLDYRPGNEIVLAHGSREASSAGDHGDLPFRIAGVLEPTGTPVDRAVHVSLEAIEAIHLGWEGGVPVRGRSIDAEEARAAELTPETVTAFLVGLRSRAAVFQVQQAVNAYPDEALTAILPGVAMQRFLGLVGVAEEALLLVSMMVVFVGLAGMMSTVLATLSERRREMAILRSVGARPGHVFGLLVGEAMALTGSGILIGTLVVQGAIAVAGPALEEFAGIRFVPGWPGPRELGLMAAVFAGGTIAGVVPAILAYRRSLSDGLSLRT